MGGGWLGDAVILWTWSLKRAVQPMIVDGVQKSSGAVGGRKFFPLATKPRNHAITRVRKPVENLATFVLYG